MNDIKECGTEEGANYFDCAVCNVDCNLRKNRNIVLPISVVGVVVIVGVLLTLFGIYLSGLV